VCYVEAVKEELHERGAEDSGPVGEVVQGAEDKGINFSLQLQF